MGKQVAIIDYGMGNLRLLHLRLTTLNQTYTYQLPHPRNYSSSRPCYPAWDWRNSRLHEAHQRTWYGYRGKKGHCARSVNFRDLYGYASVNAIKEENGGIKCLQRLSNNGLQNNLKVRIWAGMKLSNYLITHCKVSPLTPVFILHILLCRAPIMQ